MAKSNYSFNKVNTPYDKYQATLFGKIAMGIAAPSVIVSFLAMIVAFFGIVEALLIGIVTLILAFVGSIMIIIDIVAFNLRQKKKNPNKSKNEGVDMARMWHLLAGLALGVLIGFLIWGVR